MRNVAVALLFFTGCCVGGVQGHTAHRSGSYFFDCDVQHRVGQAIRRGEWLIVAEHVNLLLEEGQSFDYVMALSQDETFLRSVKASKSLITLSGTGLTSCEAVRLGFFMEGLFQRAIREHGFYLPCGVTHADRTIEQDSITGKIFIHLGTRNVARVGRGYTKEVTRSIWYGEHPQIVARAVTNSSIPNEVACMQALEGVSGVQRLLAYTVRTLANGDQLTTLFSPLYRHGTLEQFLKSHKHLSKGDKKRLALQMLKRIEVIHRMKIAHADISPRNFFIDLHKNGQTGKRTVEVILADFGRSNYIDKLHGWPEGNVAMNPPEACRTVVGEGYLQADIFALGCVFWRLWFGQNPIWCQGEFMRYPDKEKAYNCFMKLLKKHTTESKRYKALFSGRQRGSDACFERILFQMLDPDSTQRGNASFLRERLEECVQSPQVFTRG